MSSAKVVELIGDAINRTEIESLTKENRKLKRQIGLLNKRIDSQAIELIRMNNIMRNVYPDFLNYAKGC